MEMDQILKNNKIFQFFFLRNNKGSNNTHI